MVKLAMREREVKYTTVIDGYLTDVEVLEDEIDAVEDQIKEESKRWKKKRPVAADIQ